MHKRKWSLKRKMDDQKITLKRKKERKKGRKKERKKERKKTFFFVV